MLMALIIGTLFAKPNSPLYATEGPLNLVSRTVTFLLDELGLQYDSKFVDSHTQEHDFPDFLKSDTLDNFPALVDHGNGDKVVW